MYLSCLSQSSFSPFGALLKERPEGEEETILLSPGDESKQYCCSGSVILDYNEGMTVLAVYEEGVRHCFYLDRVVRLAPGVPFSVFPLEGNGSVVMLREAEDSLAIREAAAAAESSETEKTFQLQRIYTLFYQETAGNFYFRGESHPPFELVYVDQGTLHNIINGHDYVVRQQECIVIDRNHWHIQYSNQPVKFLTLSFQHTGQLSGLITNKIWQLSTSRRALLLKIMKEPNEGALAVEYIEALLQQFLIELVREPGLDSTAVKPSATSYAENLLVDSALKSISKNLSGKISLSALAQSLHISIPYLYKLFDTHLQMPPGQYIMKIRLEESKMMLRQGQKTITEIAKECGFTSCQHFSRQFHQHVGITPTEYGKSLR